MAKDPAFLFYSSDFLNGVSDLTMEERGQYITLLCLQHQKGSLSDKTIRLSVGSVSVDVMKKFSKDNEGNFFQERLREEIKKRLAFTESRRNNGYKGGRPKASDKPNGYPKNNLMENENENENEDLIDDEKGKRKSIDERQNDFLNSLRIFYPTYTKEMLKEFYDYWTEPNRSKSKMRCEMEKTWDSEKRLKTWFNNSKKFNNGTTKNYKTGSGHVTDEQINEAIFKRRNGG